MRRTICRIIVFVVAINIFSIVISILSTNINYCENICVIQFPQQGRNNLPKHPRENEIIGITEQPNYINDTKKTIKSMIDDAYTSNRIVYFPIHHHLPSKQWILNKYPPNLYHRDTKVKADSHNKQGYFLIVSAIEKWKTRFILKDKCNIYKNTGKLDFEMK